MCASTATHECGHCGLPLRYFPDPDLTDIETSEAWCGITPDGVLEPVCFGATADLYPCPTCWGTGAYVDAAMRGEVCDACDGAKVIADHAPIPVGVPALSLSGGVPHTVFSVSGLGTWQVDRCTCPTGADHIVAVSA